RSPRHRVRVSLDSLTSAQRRLLVAVVVLVAAVLLGAPRLLHRGGGVAVPPPVRVPAAPAGGAAVSRGAPLVVDVAGAVRRPGLYRLARGTRIEDALVEAGGFARRADRDAVNLAAPVADGEQIVVPVRGSGAAGASSGSASSPAGPLDLNSATAEQLDALVRFALAPAAVVLAAALLSPRLALAIVLLVGGWWWGSLRLRELDRSALRPLVGTAGIAVLEVKEPPRIGRFDVRVRSTVLRWDGAREHEPVLLELPRGRRPPPPQGARLRVIGTLRAPPDDERDWLRFHGAHVVLCASTVRVLRVRGGLADRLHAWLARASAPGLDGERRAVIEGVVLGEDGGLSDGLRQRF